MTKLDGLLYTCNIFIFLDTSIIQKVRMVIIKATGTFLCLFVVASAFHLPNQRSRLTNGTEERKLDSGSDQMMYCYDEPNCQGIRLTFGMDPVPDLGQSPYYFDNRIQSCMYYGIYILYDGSYYNRNNLNVRTIFHTMKLMVQNRDQIRVINSLKILSSSKIVISGRSVC